MAKLELFYPVKIFKMEDGINLWLCSGSLEEYIAWHTCQNLHPSLFDIVTNEKPIGVKIRGINYTLKDLPEGQSSWYETCVTKSDAFSEFGGSSSFSCPICKKTVSLIEQEAFNCCVKEKMALVLQAKESYMNNLTNNFLEKFRNGFYTKERIERLKTLFTIDTKEITGIDFSYSLEPEKPQDEN